MKRKLTDNPDVFYLAFDHVDERVETLTNAGLYCDETGTWETRDGNVRATPKPGQDEPLVFKVTGAFEVERQRFENALAYTTPITRAGHGYLNATTQSMWLAWQQARGVEPTTLYRLEKRA